MFHVKRLNMSKNLCKVYEQDIKELFIDNRLNDQYDEIQIVRFLWYDHVSPDINYYTWLIKIKGQRGKYVLYRYNRGSYNYIALYREGKRLCEVEFK
ncbi:hypothetical protein SBFV1_gp06 [Sulfolobales Beppu filamentous phage 1]|uniref:Uncharacterized protein n=1 Tax=Sulfolobales Beppu filamentous phage 1 TaxID=2493122 RepID=A0A3Q8Q379_9VIRU|nr:hypothetical protein SBFV1_gp06 [Sulfolobales Beppu filamentous phage 1]